MGIVEKLSLFFVVAATCLGSQKTWGVLVVNPYKEVTLLTRVGEGEKSSLWLLMEGNDKPTVKLKNIKNLVKITDPGQKFYFRADPPSRMPVDKNLHWVKVEKEGLCWTLRNKELTAITSDQQCKIKDFQLQKPDMVVNFPWEFANFINDQYLAMVEQLKDVEPEKRFVITGEDAEEEEGFDELLNNIPTYDEDDEE